MERRWWEVEGDGGEMVEGGGRWKKVMEGGGR